MLISRPLRLKEKVAKAMTSAKISFTSEPRIRGIVPDFLIRTSSGKDIIVETKTFPKVGNIRQAVKQTKVYRKALSSGGKKGYIGCGWDQKE